MNLITLTAPSVEPVTLAELYLFLRLTPSGSPETHPDDDLLTVSIQSARERAEQITRRALVQQSLRLVLPAFTSRVTLPRPPFVVMTQVKYYDTANVLQTLAPSAYILESAAFLPSLIAVDSWPATFDREDAVQIDYVVGYAPVGSPPSSYTANIPANIKQAIKLQVQLEYDEIAPEKREQIELAIQRLLASHRVPKL